MTDEKIRTLSVPQAASLMGVCAETVQAGLREGIFPWGYGIRTGEKRWRYWINARKFFEIERIPERGET